MVPGLQPQVVALVGECGSCHTTGVLGMAVVAVTQLAMQCLEEAVAGQPPFAFERVAVRCHADRNGVFRHGAVGAPIGAGRRANPALIEEQRAAHRTTVAAGRRVAHAPVRRWKARPGASQFDRHLDVVAGTVEVIDVQRKALVAALHQHAAFAGIAAGGIACVGAPAEAVDRLAGNAVVDDVDHTADRAATVLQRRRAAQHFDALGHQRIDRHRMVVAQRRRVHRRAAVLQDADAVAVLAANHRATGVGPEIGAADTGHAVQRLAQRALRAQQQRIARQALGRGDKFCRPQRIAGDRDLTQGRRDRIGCRLRPHGA